MISVNNAARLIKRAILANIATDKENVAITPLISGKHGIGKSAIVKTVAEELSGTCITIEGGTLKEGEITGIPYQYENEQGKMQFKFLPYYAVERIQAQEKLLFEQAGKTVEENDVLNGAENRYAQNDLTPQEKIDLLLSGKVKPVIVFVDEINRTENTVYRELMNILLTKTVNGYRFPWWVFFVGAMNPSTQNSAYATNEMDPAQLDRFLKLKVTSNANEWIRYGKKTGISPAVHQAEPEMPIRICRRARRRGKAHALATRLGHGRHHFVQRAYAATVFHSQGKQRARCCQGYERAGGGQAWRHRRDHVFRQPS